MVSLVRTPSQRGARTSSGPRPQNLHHNQPPIAGLQEPLHSQLVDSATNRLHMLRIDRALRVIFLILQTFFKFLLHFI